MGLLAMAIYGTDSTVYSVLVFSCAFGGLNVLPGYCFTCCLVVHTRPHKLGWCRTLLGPEAIALVLISTVGAIHFSVLWSHVEHI